MHIRENLQIFHPAKFPKRGVSAGVEGDGSELVGFRVKIVIANICRNTTSIASLRPQQECAAFANAFAAFAQLENQPDPKQERYTN
jgi:hypothetical protein